MVKIRLSQGTWTTHGETGVLCQRPPLTPAQHLSGGCVQRLEEGDVWTLRTCLTLVCTLPPPTAPAGTAWLSACAMTGAANGSSVWPEDKAAEGADT